MISQVLLRFMAPILMFVGMGFSAYAAADKEIDVDQLIGQTEQYLHTEPEKSESTLVQLRALQSIFTLKQERSYYLLYATSLIFRGKHKESVSLVESFIDKVNDPEFRVKFLYQLSDGYTLLGDYASALKAMNQSIVLLPNLVELGSKVTTLQAAITLLNSLHAYDEAMAYADRMYALEGEAVNALSKCYGLANRIEIGFLRGDSQKAQSLLGEATRTCDASNRKVISLIVKSLATVDLIDSGRVEQGIKAGLPLLQEFSKTNQNSDYVTQLEDAVARAYIKTGNLTLAEQYALSAYQRAKAQDVVQLMEKSSETMAIIKRAQGQPNSAIEYYDINLALKKKVLDDQLQKNLAYQRVKFDTQDKANQLTLLEQKNRILTVEKKLQQRSKESLLLLITLAVILLTVLAAWLIRTLRQKNLFRTSSQIDGLTQVCNRAHFMAVSTQTFNSASDTVSVVLFDMDHFKTINDTFGHAVGDWVLRAVSDSVKLQLGKTAILGRLGGEEFGICIQSASAAEVQALTECCRAAIASIDTQPCGFRFPISASFGIATRGHQGLLSFEETLAAADKALYFSKNEGRNRVSLYQ